MRPNTDVIDIIISDVNRERPDLDPSGMAVVGRILVLGAKIQKRVDVILKEYGLAQWSFDVLATLRRTGWPYHRSPTDLSKSTMLSTAAMVNRLDRLEQRGLVRRLPNPDDRRGIIVELTAEGLELVDRVLPPRLEDAKLVARMLPDADRLKLEELLKKLSSKL